MDFTTFRAHFWETEGEKRINRKQFIIRIILVFIVGALVSIIPNYIIPNLNMEEVFTLAFGGKISSPWYAINTILGILISYPFYRMQKAIYIKRYADFNNNGKSPKWLLPIVFFGGVFIQVLGLLITYMGTDGLINSIPETLGLYIIGLVGLSGQLMLGAIICIFLMFIISVFTSGSKGSNNYGDEPTSNPII